METNITWQAEEFKAYKKSIAWYIGFAIAAIGLLAYGIYIKDWLTIIVFALIVVIAFAYSHQKPQAASYILSNTGITINETFYPFAKIKEFWIIYSSDNKSVNFLTTASIANTISLQLGRQDPVIVREFLKKYLKEDLNKEESMTDILARKLKF